MMTPRQIAERGTFLVAEVGSSAHGTNISGVDDLDLMGVTFQPPDYLLGLQNFQQFIYRTAEDRLKFEPTDDQRKSGGQPPSQPGDIDLVIYSVQKYLNLALGGNPSVLVLLFSKKYHQNHMIFDLLDYGYEFKCLAEKIASRGAGFKFLGYLRAQKNRLLGLQGQMRVTRTEIIEKYGYDTKYAMQACRLGLQGIEFMQSGKMTLPMPKSQADTLKAMREGALTLKEAVEWIDELENQLLDAIEKSELPKQPDREGVDRWLVQSQLAFFEWRKSHPATASFPKLA